MRVWRNEASCGSDVPPELVNGYGIYYGMCRCTVWPLFMGVQMHTCGRCGNFPEAFGATYEEVAAVFKERYRTDPLPVKEE